MVTLPLFFLSNLLAFGTLSLGGCTSLPSQNPDESALAQHQEGYMEVKYPDHPIYKFFVTYDLIEDQDYTLTLSYSLMPQMVLSVKQGEVDTLTMAGFVYKKEEALNLLRVYFPEFPWGQMQDLIATGEFSHQNGWVLEDWKPGSFAVASQECAIAWTSSYTQPQSIPQA